MGTFFNLLTKSKSIYCIPSFTSICAEREGYKGKKLEYFLSHLEIEKDITKEILRSDLIQIR